MSLREEERQKNNCPSRGLGLAAAAIGVGVGAALYYFFSKRPENPDEEGSTSGWTCEQPHAFNLYNGEESEESDVSMENQYSSPTNSPNSISGSEYTTISEATTTDTSMHDTESSINSSVSSEQSEDSYIDYIPSDDELDLFNIEDFVINSGDAETHAPPRHDSEDDWDRKCEPVILEYFEHGDTDAAAEDFLEFVTAKRSYLVCETIVEIALEHKPSHCEMASVLISDLYGRVFSAKDIATAFEHLLEKLPDLVLDTPDAAVLLSNFIARCVADDCLAPRCVTQQLAQPPNPAARQSLHRAETLLSMKQGLVRLDNIWGVGGGIRPVKSLIRQIQLLLKEYLTCGDLAEAMRCVRELEVPHFHHELVYETVLLALETINSSVEEQLSTFLAELHRCALVTPDQMDRGFIRVLEDMSDIVLDVPLAYIMLDRFLERCQHKFSLGSAVTQRMPSRGRKRFVSEGDGGAIKDHALKLRE